MAFGSVGTEPEYRRLGLASHCFKLLDKVIEERGCIVSYLHPFSFEYYRSIGYERISDHRVIEIPIRGLSFLPRFNGLTRILPEQGSADLETAYNKFCLDRNAIFLRYGTVATTEPTFCEGYAYGGPYTYDFKNNTFYLSRDESGEPDGYIKLRKVMDLEHHHLFGTIHIDEICYSSPAALKKLLGFIRMYDGEADTVIFHNVGMAPEIELALRDYKYIKIQSVPDLSARFHDVETALKVVKYPQKAGTFTLRVSDTEKSPFSAAKTTGCWKVQYENEKASVEKLDSSAICDIDLTMPAFSQLIHGFMSYGSMIAPYTEGVTVYGDCSDLFRAFPNRPCGMYDLF